MNTTDTIVAEDYVRLNCRVSRRIKSRAAEAASLLGQSMTGFTEAALAEKAEAVFESRQRITLSERDFARFVERIETPPPPTPALQDALADYRRLQDAHADARL